MKKLLSFLTAMTFICSMTGCTDSKDENKSQPAEEITVSQTMYKEEHVEFPEDKRFTEGLTYVDEQGVRLIYTDSDNNYKFADYDENMAVKSTTELFNAEENAFVDFDCAADGTMIALVVNVQSDYKIGTPEYIENAEFTYELRKYAPDGSGETVISIPELGNYYAPYSDVIQNFQLIDGKILIVFSSGKLIMDLEGNILETRQEGGFVSYCEDSSGKIIAAADTGYCYMDKLSLTLPENMTEYGEYLRLNLNLGITKGYGGFTAFFMLNGGVYGMTENGSLTELFNYNDSLVSINDYRSLVYAGEGKFAGISSETDKTFLTLLTVRPDDYVMNREDITVGLIGMIDSNDQELISAYNKKNDSYKADLKAYDEMDDFTAAVLTDDAPDCISYSGTYNMRRLKNLGAVADMYELSEKYGGFKKDDILDNVAEALEIDGGLYGISQKFQLVSAIGRSDIFPNSNMTWQEFKGIYNSMPENVYFSNIMGMNLPRDVFEFLCTSNLHSFIDYEKGECNFNTPEFIEMLEFTKNVRLMPEFDWQNFYDSHTDEEINLFFKENDNRLLNGEVMVATVNAAALDDFINIKHRYHFDDGEFTLLDAPSENPQSNIFFQTLYSVVTNGKCPEGAWDYINYITSEKFLTTYLQTERSFVTFKGAFEKINKQIRWKSENPVYVDENGVTVTTFTTEKPITDEEYNMALEYISKCTIPADYNQTLYNILMEEYEAFAAGDKTAAECAEIIQNRVSIYLSENS
ncbi:MAG: hypothetical protein IJB68_02615 [Ruminococcus sp.]|nr:hypothetical protein [Ruminococcus sp.]